MCLSRLQPLQQVLFSSRWTWTLKLNLNAETSQNGTLNIRFFSKASELVKIFIKNNYPLHTMMCATLKRQSDILCNSQETIPRTMSCLHQFIAFVISNIDIKPFIKINEISEYELFSKKLDLISLCKLTIISPNGTEKYLQK